MDVKWKIWIRKIGIWEQNFVKMGGTPKTKWMLKFLVDMLKTKTTHVIL